MIFDNGFAFKFSLPLLNNSVLSLKPCDPQSIYDIQIYIYIGIGIGLFSIVICHFPQPMQSRVVQPVRRIFKWRSLIEVLEV